MKKNTLFTTVLLFWLLSISASTQAQTSGTISLHSAYTNNMSEIWNINTGVSKAVKITYSVDTEDNYDIIVIYDVSSTGSKTIIATLSGFKSGIIYTTSKTGKVEIDFISDNGISYNDGYNGFDISYAVDDRTEINTVNVIGDTYTGGNSYTAGKLGIGTTSPKATLDTRGDAYISGLAGIGTVPMSGYKLYISNSTENTAFRASTSKPTTGSIYGMSSYTNNTSSGSAFGLYTQAYSYSGLAYGLYSYVSGGSSSKRWSGYFNGGTVAIEGGKLHLTDANLLATNTTDAGKITFWDDARITVTNTIIPTIRTSSYSMPSYGIAAVPTMTSADLWLSGSSGMRMFTGGNATPRLNITNEGNVGIGTTNPQYKLDVKGQIRATEVLVQSVDNFADFVFDKNYRLPTLNDVKTYINDNKHLPNIPSAEEVKAKGMSLVEMQVKLLQKIEELTLYTIKQQEEINSLKEKIEKFESNK